jgi:hypothetical protein
MVNNQSWTAYSGFFMCDSGADLPNIIQMIKLRKLRWAGCVAHIRERRGVYGILVGKSEGRRPLKRPWHGCEDNIKMVWDAWTRLIWLRIGTGGRLL